MTKQLTACVLICLIFTSMSLAQNQPVDLDNLMRIKALEDARRDAKSDYNALFYIGVGCCTGVFGLIYEYAEEPEIKTARLMGKSPEYIEIYSAEYYRIARRRQLGYTAAGCLIPVYISIQTYARSQR